VLLLRLTFEDDTMMKQGLDDLWALKRGVGVEKKNRKREHPLEHEGSSSSLV